METNLNANDINTKINDNAAGEIIEEGNNPVQELEPENPAIDYTNEINNLKDQLLRAVAETDNVRKRAKKQEEDAANYAISSFASDLINVMENLCRTTDSITQEEVAAHPMLKTVSEGIEMTKRELINAFERNGIKRIQPLVGDEFNHNLHQAVLYIADEKHTTGTIIQVLQAGYSLRGRLLKPAMVGVAK
jgi:molecular chaperone GrpE